MCVSVADHGRGVDPEFVPHLFEMFSRGGGLDEHRKGTGLGLSIAKGLAESFGGRVWYEPNAPRGARFCLGLPRRGATTDG